MLFLCAPVVLRGSVFRRVHSLRAVATSQGARTYVPPLRCFSSSSTGAIVTATVPAQGAGGGNEGKDSKPSSLVGAYLELCKARLSALVVITSGAGFLLAGHPIDWATCAATVAGTSLAAAAANTFNQVYEVRTDGLMMRTQRRPLPTGRLTQTQAMRFGLSAAAASAGILWFGTNPLTTALGMGNILLYACVYTPMKQVSVWNTAVGAVVGAIPPLMGWAAATGSLVAWDPMLLGYTLFAWQFSHFYALAWVGRKDYARGGYFMVPVFDADGSRTARLISRHAYGLAAVPIVATALGVTSPMFLVDSAVLNGYFLYLTRKFSAAPSDAAAKAIFRTSLWYLPVLMFMLIFHAKMWNNKEEQLARKLATFAPQVLVSEGMGRLEDDKLVAASVIEGGSSRGISIGEGIEHAIACTRALGRAWCAHEVWITSQVAGIVWDSSKGSTPVRAPTGDGALAGSQAECPIPLPSSFKSQRAGAQPPSSSPSSSATVDSASLVQRGDARGLCPVVAVEHGAARLGDAVLGRTGSVAIQAEVGVVPSVDAATAGNR